jgi:hypothetical protein
MISLKPINLPPSGSDTGHSLFWGFAAAALLIAGIVVGSRGLKDFDPALVSYAGGTVFAAFGLGYCCRRMTLLLAVNAGLLRYVFRFDRDAHGE